MNVTNEQLQDWRIFTMWLKVAIGSIMVFGRCYCCRRCNKKKTKKKR